MFSYITSFLENPREMLIFLLLSIPGRFMALSLHEFAHAWMANRCGDPTARMLGRLTANPAKHLDPVGTVMMLLLGFGWAKPVPVNPRNYRNLRWDDLKVSIAGVTMNLAMFVLSFLLMCGFVGFTIHGLPHLDSASIGSSGMFTANLLGQRVVCTGEYYFNAKDLFTMAPYVADYLIAPALGRMAGYIYQMLSYFVLVNIALAVFNLIPVPPLDGYHVLNDLILKGRLFASRQAQGISMAILYLAMFSGALSEVLSRAYTGVLTGVGALMSAVFRAFGLF